MKAIGNFLIIKELEAKGPVKTKGGLLLAKEDQEDIRYIQASVLSVGNPELGVRVGDVVYFDKFAGHELNTDEDVKPKVIKATDIVAVI